MGMPERAPDSAQRDLDYIKKSMQKTNLGGLAVEAQQHRENQIETSNRQWLENFHQQSDEGFKVLLQEIFKSAKDGVISLSDDIEPITIEDCLVDRYGLEIMKDPERLQQFIDGGGNLQELYGYSNAVMLNLYDVGQKLLEDKRHKDAINAFSFLCNLNPNVPSFWIALGIANEQDLKWSEALEAFQIAISQDPSDFESYLGLIRCCGSIKDYTLAKQLLESAADIDEIKDQVAEALAYIQSKEKPIVEEEKEEEVNEKEEEEKDEGSSEENIDIIEEENPLGG